MSSYVTVKCKERDINGRAITFYALPMALTLRLGVASQKIIEAVAQMVTLGDPQYGKLERDILEDGKLVCIERQTNAESADSLGLRSALFSQSWGKVVESLVDPKIYELFAEIILSSAREETEVKGAPSKQELEAFRSAVDLPTFIEMLRGVADVNFEAFSPLRHKLATAIDRVTGGSGKVDLGAVAPSLLRKLPKQTEVDAPLSSN